MELLFALLSITHTHQDTHGHTSARIENKKNMDLKLENKLEFGTELTKLSKTNRNIIKKEFQNKSNEEKKILNSLELLLEGQRVAHKDLQLGFIGLAKQNSELLILNEKLNQQLEIVLGELNKLKKEREEKETRKEARANRKRLPKRDPMTAQIYKELIKEAEGPTYIDLRTRMAICILAVTGVRINELLPLKVGQLKTLFEEHWIAIDRSKRGPSNHKAFLTKEGKKLIRNRQKDFQLIFLMKKLDSYVFTAEADHYRPLNRVAITNNVNKALRKVSSQLPGQPNVTSHSFRIGYITQLWRDTKDIEFVKQTIGHQNLDTTSAYIKELSNQERKKRIDELK